MKKKYEINIPAKTKFFGIKLSDVGTDNDNLGG